ncbi:hypothetical protein OB13_05045 [Pontibacter sp. HJ8]
MKGILENVLMLAFKQFEEPEKELPIGERSKLEQLKTAKDFYAESKSTKDIQELGSRMRKSDE